MTHTQILEEKTLSIAEYTFILNLLITRSSFANLLLLLSYKKSLTT